MMVIDRGITLKHSNNLLDIDRADSLVNLDALMHHEGSCELEIRRRIKPKRRMAFFYQTKSRKSDQQTVK